MTHLTYKKNIII